MRERFFSLLVSCSFVFSGATALAGAAVSCTPVIAASIALLSSPVEAKDAVRMSANDLLADMRSSLAMMAISYEGGVTAPEHRTTTVVLGAISQTARATQGLQQALTSKDKRAISSATKTMSQSVGGLQTRYSLSAAKNDQATNGLRRFNAAWRAYASRYVLSDQKQRNATVSPGKVRNLQRKVSILSKRVSELEADVADNAALRGEVGRLRRDLAYFERRPAEPATYQNMVFALTIFSGSLDALVITTRDYYPRYYKYFEVGYREERTYDAYWSGYYDVYYDSIGLNTYLEPVMVYDPIIQVEQPVIYQTVNYQTIYNITNENTTVYENLPKEDLSNTAVEPLPNDVDFSVMTVKADLPSDIENDPGNANDNQLPSEEAAPDVGATSTEGSQQPGPGGAANQGGQSQSDGSAPEIAPAPVNKAAPMETPDRSEEGNLEHHTTPIEEVQPPREPAPENGSVDTINDAPPNVPDTEPSVQREEQIPAEEPAVPETAQPSETDGSPEIFESNQK